MKSVIEFDTAIGTSNTGDEIILDCLRKEMAFLFDESFVMRFGTHVKNFESSRYLFGSEKIDFAQHADYKLIMGTNLLTRDVKKTRAQWPIDGIGSWLYVNSILAGVGTTLSDGPVTSKTKKIYERILRKNFYHSVRDEESKKLLESIGFKAINTGCPTLWAFTPELCAKIPTRKANRVVFSLSGYENQQNRKNDQLLLDILRNNYTALYFWCQTSVDEAYLNSFDGTQNIPRIYSLEGYKKLLNEGDLDYIGTRLHGGVYALQHGVRSIVISIDHRAQGFHDTNNLPICKREDIAERLNTMINSELVTDIHVDREAIERWKEQFRCPREKPPVKNHLSVWYIKIIRGLRRVYNGGKSRILRLAGAMKRVVKSKIGGLKHRLTVSRARVQRGNTVFFTFQGEYTCNPKYIGEELQKRKPEWKQTWVALSPEQKEKNSYPTATEVVVFGTEEYYKALGEAEFMVDNAFNFVKGYAPKKRGQYYIETMHGSLGIKKISPDVVPDAARNKRGYLCGKLTDFCLSNSAFEDMVYETSFWPKKSIVRLGHARNDIFFIDEERKKEIRRKVYTYFGLNGNENLVLYAPTFRNQKETTAFPEIDFQALREALVQRFGGEWIILNREHRTTKKNRIIMEDYVKDANRYPDIQELMIAIHVGITDYSSWIFDYVLTEKAGFLYVPDLDNYTQSRGFYYPIRETPFPIVQRNEELKTVIGGFDEAAYVQDVRRFLKDKGCVDDGHASERIVDLMVNTDLK